MKAFIIFIYKFILFWNTLILAGLTICSIDSLDFTQFSLLFLLILGGVICCNTFITTKDIEKISGISLLNKLTHTNITEL